jgi:DNA polymerase zeta
MGTSSRKKARLVEPSTSASLIPSRSLHAPSYRPSLRSRPPDLGTSTYAYTTAPPKASELVLNVEAHGLHQRLYRAPWYSDPDDAPDGPREFAGLVYHLKGGDGVEILEEWLLDTNAELTTQPAYTPSSGWEFQGQPPTAREARLWIMNAQGRENEWEEKRKKWRSQVGTCNGDVVFCR